MTFTCLGELHRALQLEVRLKVMTENITSAPCIRFLAIRRLCGDDGRPAPATGVGTTEPRSAHSGRLARREQRKASGTALQEIREQGGSRDATARPTQAGSLKALAIQETLRHFTVRWRCRGADHRLPPSRREDEVGHSLTWIGAFRRRPGPVLRPPRWPTSDSRWNCFRQQRLLTWQ